MISFPVTVFQPMGGEDTDLTYDRFTDQSAQMSYLSQTTRPFRSKYIYTGIAKGSKYQNARHLQYIVHEIAVGVTWSAF